MDMEGTKHEKAVIVVLAYIVGFTSGFIAFGVTQPDLQSVAPIETVSEMPMSNDSAPVDAATENPMIDEANAAPTAAATETDYNTPKYTDGTHVYYENGRLFVSTNGTVALLSIEKNRMAANVTEFFRNQGSHVSIPYFVLSPDNSFVYFCEQQAEQDSCVSFIYDIANETIQYVVTNGEKITTDALLAKSATWNGSVLTIGTLQSETPEMPWKMK